jgi:predicted RNA-binding Zn ribbon-like protein
MDSLSLEFINSEWRDFRGRWVRDDLLQEGWLPRLLTRWNVQVEVELDEKTQFDLIELRTLLQHLAEKLAHEPLTPADLDSLNAIMARVPVSQQLSITLQGYQLDFIPEKRDWIWVQAEIVASFARLLIQHDPRRLRVCANSHCRYVFYDETKSRTQRFCNTTKCANLVKVRRFRARHTPSSERS